MLPSVYIFGVLKFNALHFSTQRLRDMQWRFGSIFYFVLRVHCMKATICVRISEPAVEPFVI